MYILIDVKNKIAKRSDPNAFIVCGNSDYKIKFTFDEEWNEYGAKTARFYFNGQFEDVVFTGDECPVPVMSRTDGVFVGVFAGDLHTTTKAYIPCEKSILCLGGKVYEPTPDVYSQIMELLNDVIAGGGTGEAVELRDYQKKRDEGLQTNSKLIVEAINEVNEKAGQGSGGGIAEESDPTVPAWAKEPTKPTYTYEEIQGKPDLLQIGETDGTAYSGAKGKQNEEAIINALNEAKAYADEKAVDSAEASVGDDNVLTIDIKDKNGNVIATTSVTLPSGGGGSPDLSNYVQKTQYANDAKVGVVQTSAYRGIQAVSNGLLVIRQPTDSYINNRNNGTDQATTFAVTLSKFDYALRKALTDGQLTLTDEEKAQARALLGIE